MTAARVQIDVGPIGRIRALEVATDAATGVATALASQGADGAGFAVVTGTLGSGLNIDVPGAIPGDVVAGTPGRVVGADVLKVFVDTINTSKLDVLAKASPAETVSGSSQEKWVTPYGVKVAISSRIVDVASPESAAVEALADLIDDRMDPTFSNAVFDDTGATGAAQATLENVAPMIGRTNLRLGAKMRSFEDVSTGLSSSAYATAIEALIQASIDDGGSVLIPPNTFSLVRGLEVDGLPNLIGYNDASVWVCGVDQPHLTCNIGEYTTDRTVSGFRAVNTLGTVANTNTSVIRLAGDSHFVENCKFLHLKSEGCFTTMHNAMGVRPSIHGNENWFNNNLIADIWTYYLPDVIGVLNAKYSFLAEDGSGTGNEFRNFKGNQAWDTGATAGDLETKPAILRFKAQTPSTVIGDITFSVGQATALNAALISVDVGAYMANVRLLNGQLDAQAKYLARFTTVPTTPVYGWVIDVAVGGDLNPAADLPQMIGSTIILQGADRREVGVSVEGIGTGAHTFECFQIDIRGWDFVEFTLDMGGLVQGVGGGGRYIRGRIDTTDTTATVSIIENTSNSGAANFFKLTLGGTGRTVTMSVEFTASGSPSHFSSILRTKGGGYVVQRTYEA